MAHQASILGERVRDPYAAMTEINEYSWPFHPDGEKVYKRHGLHKRFQSGPNYKVRGYHHLCVDRRIKPYARVLCSRCRYHEGLDIVMSEGQIREWNDQHSEGAVPCILPNPSSST